MTATSEAPGALRPRLAAGLPFSRPPKGLSGPRGKALALPARRSLRRIVNRSHRATEGRGPSEARAPARRTTSPKGFAPFEDAHRSAHLQDRSRFGLRSLTGYRSEPRETLKSRNPDQDSAQVPSSSDKGERYSTAIAKSSAKTARTSPPASPSHPSRPRSTPPLPRLRGRRSGPSASSVRGVSDPVGHRPADELPGEPDLHPLHFAHSSHNRK